MKNLGGLMKQAQQMQARMEQMQAELASAEFEGSAAGGMVTIKVTGKGEMRGVSIDPSLIDPEDKEMLEDLIVAAYNDARTKADETSAAKMKEVTGGLKLPPGMSLPF